jgi:4-amino-4-deoxy-L-arabinose transferase-like glycosyltransferase
MNLETAIKRAWRHPIGQVAIVLLITVMAAGLRFAALDAWPPGLYRDEAYNGLDALGVLELLQSIPWPANLTRLPIFFEANNGREPLFIYLLALAVHIWGRSPGALRLVSALLGTLTIPAIYGLGQELFDHEVGVVAALLATTTVWTLNASRVAFRAVAMTPLLALALMLLWRGLQRRRRGALALGGLVYGLSFYTYLAARMSVVALFLFMIYMLLWHRRQVWLRGWLLFALVAALVVAPLAGYALRHWDATVGRMTQVSLLQVSGPSEGVWHLGKTLLRSTWRTLGAFFWRGDFIPRHNVPLRPVWTPWIAAAFAGGLIVSVRRIRQPVYGLTVIWLAIMLLPTILAEDAPHFLRASGVLPMLFFVPALGLVEGVRWARRRAAQKAPAIWLVVGLVLSLSAIQDVTTLAQHMRSEAAYYQFESAAAQLAVEINTFRGIGWTGNGVWVTPTAPPDDSRVYLDPQLWQEWPTIRYLCPEGPDLVRLDEAKLEAPPVSKALLAVWPFGEHAESLRLLPSDSLIRVREGAHERGDLEIESRLLYLLYEAGPTDALGEGQPLAVWEQDIGLLGYHLERLPEHMGQITLYWQATSPVDGDYTVFRHVLAQGTQVGQGDGPPALGYYPTSRWRPGDLVEDVRIVVLDQKDESERLCMRVGLYRWETMERLTIEFGDATAERTYVELCE